MWKLLQIDECDSFEHPLQEPCLRVSLAGPQTPNARDWARLRSLAQRRHIEVIKGDAYPGFPVQTGQPDSISAPCLGGSGEWILVGSLVDASLPPVLCSPQCTLTFDLVNPKVRTPYFPPSSCV